MDYGIFAWFGYMLPLKERFSLIRQAGFSAVCTWWADLDPEADGPRTAQRELAEQAGLRLENAHLPYYGCDALWKAGLAGDAFCDGYVKDIRLAREAGIPTLVLHPFELDVPAGGSFAVFLTRLRHLLDIAEQNGVRLAMENLANWPALIRILDGLWPHPALGFCFDSGHANVVSRGDFSLLDRYGEKLLAIHMHDNNHLQDQHLLPGAGDLPWAQLLPALSATGYPGAFMLESCYPFDMDTQTDAYLPPPVPAELYLAEAYAACCRLFSPAQATE